MDGRVLVPGGVRGGGITRIRLHHHAVIVIGLAAATASLWPDEPVKLP